jgi:hypothetical protein
MIEIKGVFDGNALGGPELLEAAQLGLLLYRDDVLIEVKLFRVEPEHLIPQLTDRCNILSVFRPHLALPKPFPISLILKPLNNVKLTSSAISSKNHVFHPSTNIFGCVSPL